ncbi:hypothetical protein EDB19DRAFT_1683747, partial [Suillus lakei]
MSTRKRSKRDRASSKASHEAPTSLAKEKYLPGSLSEGSDHVNQSNLPPSRPHKEILTPVSPPGYRTPLRYFIYTLVTTALFSHGVHWKEEVGWWGMSVGRFGRQHDKSYRDQWRGQEVTGELEGHLSQLASALGIPATDVASG